MDTSAPFVDPGETVEQTPAGEVTARKAMPRPPPLDVGGRIGRYVLVGPLGMGGMGMVYRAYDPKLQREVALKRLRADASAERGEARMIREARAMAQLSHPNVVAVYDVEDSDGELTLAMELVEGRTLHEWLDKEHRVAQILTVLVEAGRGLAAAHAAGLVHRDFKPANVLVTTDGVAKVTDFGLAKGRGLGAAADPSAARRCTWPRSSSKARRRTPAPTSMPSASRRGGPCSGGTRTAAMGRRSPRPKSAARLRPRVRRGSPAASPTRCAGGSLPIPVIASRRWSRCSPPSCLRMGAGDGGSGPG
jgi:serine/threonine protein kinase